MKKIFFLCLIYYLCAPLLYGQWVRTSAGQNAGNILSLAVAASAIYAGTDGGVYVSRDDGESWELVINGLTDTYTQVLTVDGNTVYAGTQAGLFVSSNMGDSWRPTGLVGKNILSLAVASTALYAATSDGVFRSTDHGVNWEEFSTGLTNKQVNALAIVDSHVYAGSITGLFSLSDSGSGWVSAGALQNAFIQTMIASADSLYVGFGNGGVFRFRNSTGGKNININTPSSVTCLAIKGKVLIAGTDGGGVFTSANNGDSWEPTNAGLPSLFVRSLAISKDAVFVGLAGGLFASADNGSTWRSSGNGLSNINVYDLTLVEGGILFCSDRGGISLSTDNMVTWQPSNSGMTTTNVITSMVNENRIFAGTADGVFVSDDNGSTWAQSGVPSYAVSAIERSGGNLFASTYYHGMYISSDNGLTWQPSQAGLYYPYFPNIFCIASDGSNVFLGSGGYGVFMSSDDGQLWTQVNNGLAGPVVTALLIKDNKLIAGTDQGVYYSADEAKTWNTLGLSDYQVLSLAVMDTTIIAGTFQHGMFFSNDEGLNWTPLVAGMPSGTTINSLLVRENEIIAGTEYFGIWSMEFSGKAPQIITLDSIADLTLGDPPANFSATSTSGLPVVLSFNTSKIAISGNQLTALLAGPVTIEATQHGNSHFEPASASIRFCVKPPKPSIEMTENAGSAIVLTSSAPAGNQWFLNGSPLVGATSPSIIAENEGTYTVQTSVGDCLSTMSDGQSIVVTGIENLYDAYPSFYPNPASSRLFIWSNGGLQGIEIYDLLGRLVHNENGSNDETIGVDVAGLPSGAYVLRIYEPKQVFNFKFLKD